MTSPKVLPSSWVEKIFARLVGIYGREFTSQFASGVVDGVDRGIENAKEVWAEELGMFADNPDALRYGLKNLPERSPNCIKFREICKLAPKPIEPKRITHQMTQEQREANMARVREAIQKLGIRINTDDNNGNGAHA